MSGSEELSMKRAIAILIFLVSSYSMAAAAEKKPLGAHGAMESEAFKVIDEKCLVCHNRRRIDTAMNNRRDMEKIQKIMEGKGAALTEKERQVLGHFWKQNPFKEKAREMK